MGFQPPRVTVVHPGVDPRFTPGGERAPHPLVLAVGRLVPVKQHDLLIEALVELNRRPPTLEAVIAGDGYKRDELEAQLHAARAEDWIHLPGRISDEEVVDLYRRAWVLASSSAREGWGMTITEAAACGTPAVVTRIAGHLDAVDDGRSGLLITGHDELVGALDQLLRDPDLRAPLRPRALPRASNIASDAPPLRGPAP